MSLILVLKFQFTLKLNSVLNVYYDDVMSRLRQSPQHKSCSFMCLEFTHELSAHLEWYNFSYGPYSTTTLFLYSLSCVDDLVVIEDYFGKMLNMKVAED